MENGMERVDIAIIGTGPAGVSAAITAKVRNKSVLLIGSRELSEKMSVWKKSFHTFNHHGIIISKKKFHKLVDKVAAVLIAH